MHIVQLPNGQEFRFKRIPPSIVRGIKKVVTQNAAVVVQTERGLFSNLATSTSRKPTIIDAATNKSTLFFNLFNIYTHVLQELNLITPTVALKCRHVRTHIKECNRVAKEAAQVLGAVGVAKVKVSQRELTRLQRMEDQRGPDPQDIWKALYT